MMLLCKQIRAECRRRSAGRSAMLAKSLGGPYRGSGVLCRSRSTVSYQYVYLHSVYKHAFSLLKENCWFKVKFYCEIVAVNCSHLLCPAPPSYGGHKLLMAVDCLSICRQTRDKLTT